MEAASTSLGFRSRKHQDWFDENNTDVHKLLKARNDAYAVKLQNPMSVSHDLRWKALRSQVQKELRQMENSWWVSKASEIQSYADTNDTQKFYEAIKATYGPSHHSVHPVRSKDGNTPIKDQQGILARWAEHLGDLLNHISSTDPSFIDLLLQLPPIPELDHLQDFHEVHTAIKGLKNNKSAGPDTLPAEVL